MTGCVPSASSQSREPRWTTAFWFWNDGYVDKMLPAEPLDVLFVRVGEIRKDTPPLYIRAPEKREERWVVWGELPKELPPAQEYWLVFRFEQQGVPDPAVIPTFEEALSRLAVEARYQHLKVAGVQLDIDSPTNSLPQYAKFLAELRPKLPGGYQLSITALLDWFRSGTGVGEVIAQTDEFVPQSAYLVLASQPLRQKWTLPVGNRSSTVSGSGFVSAFRASDVADSCPEAKVLHRRPCLSVRFTTMFRLWTLPRIRCFDWKQHETRQMNLF